MKPTRYRKKSDAVEVMQFNAENYPAIAKWMISHSFVKFQLIDNDTTPYRLRIATSERDIETALPGDWIIRGTSGEFYLCKPHIFDEIYEVVAL